MGDLGDINVMCPYIIRGSEFMITLETKGEHAQPSMLVQVRHGYYSLMKYATQSIRKYWIILSDFLNFSVTLIPGGTLVKDLRVVSWQPI